ncbi:polyribonucleotide nucleotidyltransferase [Synechococcus sp. PCC 7336]|uniref:polyribonucleotide nucleotidyltransferase n=1 Tax=Synechococcus sp. PCC 7336 TaxID=195250 RepID=UPI00034682EF|nr:polyribonucleotide nucleotidyltransferase [Synechococcus sp. PCC 7336]
MNEYRKSISFYGREIEISTGLLAPQAGGAVTIQSGDTCVLVTATQQTGRPGIDFMPLMVDYEERLYAAGRIPGGFLRREGRPPERATLTSRLIDRPMRPLFPGWLRDDVQIVATTLSVDETVPPDILCITAASIAVRIAQCPFAGPVAAVRVGLVDDEFIINPTYAEIEAGDLDLVVAGTPKGIIMVEAGADRLPENDVIEAIDFAYEAIQELLAAQEEISQDLELSKVEGIPPEANSAVDEFVAEQAQEKIQAILKQFLGKNERDSQLDELKEAIVAALEERPEDDPLRLFAAENPKAIAKAFKALTKTLMRKQIVDENIRVDGRKLDEVRPISCQAGLVPKVHGSGLFTRGLTQVLSITTLGTPGDAQELDDLHPAEQKRYLHHYNFPAYSVGETKPARSPGRREIGHGALAERALLPVLPPSDSFGYVLRVVSEVLSSNGSTSMGSVCGSSLSLMDAGVPIAAPVGGVAMGLIREGAEERILTDIQGIEDFLGDMDFKVAGTESGITALQMDMKIDGITVKTVSEAIRQAKAGRLHILSKMAELLPAPRADLAPTAPRLLTFKISPDAIGQVIGPGGKTIKGIVEATGAKVDIEDDGTVVVSSNKGGQAEAAKKMIEGMTRRVEEGQVYMGKVTRIIPIGAFVEFLPKKEGMIHISQLADYRVGKVEDEVAVGDDVVVKVRSIDNRGRINLTRLGISAEEATEVREAVAK